jgi:hypothetical protein
MVDRRNGNRKRIELPVTKQTGDAELLCRISDISPTGVRLLRGRRHGFLRDQQVLNLELHLVPGSITTVISARQVWSDDQFEAFEFVAPSFAQQAIIERMLGNI